MLSWDRETLTFSPHDPHGQPEWQRKELLYHEIIRYFDKGKCWEKGIPLCKELAILYETRRFDYNSLSEILTMEAKFFQNILTQLRPEPEYFRVGFFGTGFPLFVRNKQFVYRGLEYERIAAFTQRLQTEFPLAQILSKNTPPDQAILQSPEQYIQISNVRPISEIPNTSCAMVPIPDKIGRFYQFNDVTRFIHDRPNYKGPVDRENEFKSLWIERTTIEIAAPLPGILRWFEVTSRSVQELNPVEFACETMGNVGKELWDLVAQYKSDPKRNINPFSMRLQGVIDANVMGGISKYQEAFFNDEFLKAHPHQSANVQRLKTLILEQAQVLDTALDLHGQLAPSSVQPLQKRLMERFQQMRQSLSGLGKLKRQHSESIVNTPLPPLPIEKRAMSLGAPNAGSLGLYHDPDDNYTKPMESKSKESLNLLDHSAPPIPARPKSSAGYMPLSDSPDVPPKAPPPPPLPPRGYTPDKRNSNSFPDCADMQQQAPRRQTYSVVNIDFDDDHRSHEAGDHYTMGDDNEIMVGMNQQLEILLNDFRDSGISTSSHELNNLNGVGPNVDGSRHHHQQPRGHQKTNSNPEVLNIKAAELLSLVHSIGPSGGSLNHHPPPIPPKGPPPYDKLFGAENSSTASCSSMDKLSSSSPLSGSSSSRQHLAGATPVSGEDMDGLATTADGYCVPKSPPNN